MEKVAKIQWLPHWDDRSEEWDTITLGSYVLPGVWDVEDGNVKRVLDIKKAPGRDGATIKDEGYENGRLRLVGQLISNDDWKALQVVMRKLHPRKKGTASQLLRIVHPKSALMGIHTVTLSEISIPRLDNGVMTITIEVVEHVVKAVETKKPTKEVVSLDKRARETREAALARQPPSGLDLYPGFNLPTATGN